MALFRPDGPHIHLAMPIVLREAALGVALTMPTLGEKVESDPRIDILPLPFSTPHFLQCRPRRCALYNEGDSKKRRALVAVLSSAAEISR